MSQDCQTLTIVKKLMLLDQACNLKVTRDAIRTKNYSMKPEEAYVHWIKNHIFPP